MNSTFESTNVPGTSVGCVLHQAELDLFWEQIRVVSMLDLFREQVWGGLYIAFTLDLFPEQVRVDARVVPGTTLA